MTSGQNRWKTLSCERCDTLDGLEPTRAAFPSLMALAALWAPGFLARRLLAHGGRLRRICAATLSTRTAAVRGA
jgi:hypothetical protein